MLAPRNQFFTIFRQKRFWIREIWISWMPQLLRSAFPFAVTIYSIRQHSAKKVIFLYIYFKFALFTIAKQTFHTMLAFNKKCVCFWILRTLFCFCLFLRQNLTLLPRLGYSGTIILLGSSDPPTSASKVAGTTGIYHHTQLIFFLFF